MKNIAICAGHGLSTKSKIYDPGAIGNGFEEYMIVKEIAKFASDYLKANYNCGVELINYNKDKNLNERINYCNQKKFDFVAEIHMNASTCLTATGIEAYYNTATGKKVADLVCKNLSSTLSLSQRSNGLDDGGDKATTYFGIVCRTTMPAILIETCFITNPTDVSKVSTSEKQKLAGIAIAKAIASGLSISPKNNTSATTSKKYYAQVGSFANVSNANAYKKVLIKAGYSDTKTLRYNDKYLVAVGPFNTQSEANAYKTKLNTNGYPNAYVRAFNVVNNK